MAVVNVLISEIRGINPANGLRYAYYSLQEQITEITDPTPLPILNDLVIYIPTVPLGVPDKEIYRVLNVGGYGESFINGQRYAEMRGQISSFGTPEAPTLTQDDGWVELRLNGRVYKNGDDFSAIDPLSEQTEAEMCTTGVTRLNTRHAFGWQVGTWTIAYGSGFGVKCVYLDEYARYCTLPLVGGVGGPGATGPGEPCPPPGPGGSSFDGVPDGIRFVARGGFPASYVPPTGEGLPATASDETDPQLLSAITTPLVSLDLTLVDASVWSFSKVAIVRTALESVAAAIVWGDVPYPLSDRFGNMPAQTWEVEIPDPLGTIRGWLAAGANRFYKRWEGQLYVEDNAARLVGTARRSVARGRCTTVRTDRDLVVTLVFSDEFSRHDSPYSLDRELSHILIGEVFSIQTTGSDGLNQITDPTETIASRPIPIIYGEASDEYLITLNPPLTPIGICKLHYVGDFLVGGSERWHGYVIALYAVHTLPALFGSNLHPECPASVRLDPELFGNQFLVPGWGAWDDYFSTHYIDLVTNGVTTRTTMIFGRGPISQHHVDGKVPLSCNVCGIEDVGDATGTMIDDAAYIVQHLLDHPILRATRTGTWGAVAAFPDGVAKIKTSDFAAVKVIHDTRISDPSSAGGVPVPFNWIDNGDLALDPLGETPGWFHADFTGTGWGWSGGAAVHTAGTAGNLRVKCLAGEGVFVRFDLTGYTAGTFQVTLWDSAPSSVVGFDAGTQEIYFYTEPGANGSGDSALSFNAVTDSFNGTIDNVRAYNLADETAEAPTSRLGYRGALIIDERRAARDWLADVLVSYDMRIGLNHHGQVTAMTKPTSPTLTSLVTFTEHHIQDGSFRLTSELNTELENSLSYEFGPAPASGRLLGGARTVKAAASVTSWGDTYKAQPLIFVGIYRRPVGQDVAGRRLAETQDGITRGEFVVNLAGGELSGGQFIQLSHLAGLGTTGWLQRLVMATQRVLHLNEPPPNLSPGSQGHWFTTTTTFEDQQTGYVAPAGMVGGGVTSDGITTSRIGFNPIGTTAGADGWLVGTTAAGNGWTVG